MWLKEISERSKYNKTNLLSKSGAKVNEEKS